MICRYFFTPECCEIRLPNTPHVACLFQPEWALDCYSQQPTTPFASSFLHTQDIPRNALTTIKPPRSNSENEDNPTPSPFQLPYWNPKTHHDSYSQLKPTTLPTTFHTHPFDNNRLFDRTKQLLLAPQFKSERPTVQLFHPLIYAPAWFSMMQFIDIFSLVLSLLGLYGIVFSLKLLLPRNVVPLVSTSLNEAIALLENAEANNTLNVSDYRVDLAMYVLVYN
jgi:hypothetical protein